MGFQVEVKRKREAIVRERKRDGETEGERKRYGVRVRRGWHTKARVSPSNRAH